MTATAIPLLHLTAQDLLTREVVTLRAGMPLRDAARLMAAERVHGAPVVDAEGRCVGVLSVSDLMRWALRDTDSSTARPRTCSFQENYRETRGRETVLCTLPEGKCHYQIPKTLSDGRVVMACSEPHCVCLEWQMVEMECLPAEDVRHYMTADPVMATPTTPITTLARMMIDAAVGRVIVVTPEGRPIGVVSSTNLVAALARANANELD